MDTKSITVEEDVIVNQSILLESGDVVKIHITEAKKKKEKKKAKSDVSEIINALIDSEWSKDNDKGKAVGLFKGLMFSDDAKAVKFVKDLDALTSKMKKDSYK